MATAAAAVVAKARRDVVDHFMHADAVTPDKAVGYSPQRRLHRRQFARLVAGGILIESAPGRWHLDMPAYAAQAKKRRRFALAGLGVAAAVAAAVGFIAG